MMGAWFQFLDQETFYLSLDSELLVDVISTDLSYLKVREGGRGKGRRGEGERERGGEGWERERERGEKDRREREGERVLDGEGRNTCSKTFFMY